MKDFQLIYSNKCAIHECSQQTNMMLTLRIAHKYRIMLIFNDVLTEYPAWSADTNDIENTNKAQFRENRQDILNAWQTDTSVKTPDNR